MRLGLLTLTRPNMFFLPPNTSRMRHDNAPPPLQVIPQRLKIQTTVTPELPRQRHHAPTSSVAFERAFGISILPFADVQ